MKIRIGIDLGTTNTLACYMKNSKPKIIKFNNRDALPSVIYVEEDGTVSVGLSAKHSGIMDPLNCIRSSKTEIGNFDKVWELRGKKFTPTDVAAEILKTVRNQTVKRLKLDENEEIEAVITVPAYFTSNQIDETKKAGERAGLTVLGIVTEPRSAAIANIKSLGLDKEKIFIVDLGGGTFDVSILETNGAVYNTIKVDGDRHLGGDDFDQRLFTYIKGFIEEDLGIDLSSQQASGLGYSDYNSMIGRILEAASEVKIELSSSDEATVEIPNLFPYKDRQYSLVLPLTQDMFYSLCADLFEQIRSRVLRVLRESGTQPGEINHVILAGGSCYIPKIQSDMKEIFGQLPVTSIDRSTMVVLGACFIADTWDDMSTGRDIISHSLGIETLREDGRLVLTKLLNCGDSYPNSAKHIFTTTMDNQSSVSINIYEASSDKEDIPEIEAPGDDGEAVPIHDLYGSFELDGIQRAAKGVPQIEVTFEYDRSRLLTVTAKDLVTGVYKQIAVTKGTRKKTAPRQKQVTFELLMDSSGSMGDMVQAKRAAKNLIEEIIDLSVHQLGIISFSWKATELHPISKNKAALSAAIDSLRSTGTTAMDEAIELGMNKLIGHSEQKVMLIVTDGQPDYEWKAKDAANRAKQQGIDIIAIGVGYNRSGFDYLKTLVSKESFAYTVDSMSKLSEIFQTAINNYIASKN